MSQNTQNFNSLLRFVKRKLGVPTNLLEFSDEDIYDIIMEDVLPEISQYIGKFAWIRLSNTNLAPTSQTESENTYIIPIPEGEVLIDVLNAYSSRESAGTLGMMSGALNFYDPRDTVMMNTFIDMLRSLDIVQTYHFMAPNKIAFDLPLQSDIIIECKFEHSDLTTVPSDIYRDFVKPLTLAEVYENIAANRAKFESVNTPFGPLNLNYQFYEDKGRTLKEEVKQKFEALPHDHLIAFLD
jgi:hypothetical protein